MKEDKSIKLNDVTLTEGQIRFIIYTALANKTSGVVLDTVEGCKEAATLVAAFISELMNDDLYMSGKVKIVEIEEWIKPQEPPANIPTPNKAKEPIFYKEPITYGMYEDRKRHTFDLIQRELDQMIKRKRLATLKDGKYISYEGEDQNVYFDERGVGYIVKYDGETGKTYLDKVQDKW